MLYPDAVNNDEILYIIMCRSFCAAPKVIFIYCFKLSCISLNTSTNTDWKLIKYIYIAQTLQNTKSLKKEFLEISREIYITINYLYGTSVLHTSFHAEF